METVKDESYWTPAEGLKQTRNSKDWREIEETDNTLMTGGHDPSLFTNQELFAWASNPVNLLKRKLLVETLTYVIDNMLEESYVD